MPAGGAPDAPVVLYLHGGGFAHGSVGAYRPLISRVALATGARTIAPDYRLAPEHPFPAALEDTLAVLRALRGPGRSEARIFVAGDSAGGNLAAATLLALRNSRAPSLAGGILICPWLDLDARGGSVVTNSRFDWVDPESFEAHADAYVPLDRRLDPLASPAHADLTGLPPLHVQVGDAELLLDQVREFVRRARAAGVEASLDVYPRMTHVWHSFGGALPTVMGAFDAIGRFVRRQLASGAIDLGGAAPG